MNEIDPELIEKLKDKIPKEDWQTLQSHLNEEKNLDSLRNVLFGKLDQNQRRMELEWHQLNMKQKCDLMAEIQNILYELQLVEHASKKPLLNVAKILFSANPARCQQREASPAKSKPPKRRKNELGGLTISSSNEEIGTKRLTAREAKLIAVTQVVQQQEMEIMDEPGPSGSNFGAGKRGGRVRRKTRTIAVTKSLAYSPIGEKDEEMVAEANDEDDQGSLNLVLKSPSPPVDEDCPAAAGTNSPVRSDGQQTISPLGTRTTRKRGREASGAADSAGIAGGRSPRKRAAGAERQRNHSESNGTAGKEDGDEEEVPTTAAAADEPTYCLCEQISFGDMICCDYELCSVEWFHFACVSIKSKPKGKKWYCPLCRHNDKPNLLKPELLQKLEHIKKVQAQ